MPWILDGNNLAGGRDRDAVRRAALAVGRREKVRLTVFFDGAPPVGTGDVERLGSVEIRYARDADAAILSHLPTGCGDWIVATDDRALALQVRSRGARVVAAAGFWRKAAAAAQTAAGEGPPARVDGEMEFFQDPAKRLPDAPARIARRQRRRRR